MTPELYICSGNSFSLSEFRHRSSVASILIADSEGLSFDKTVSKGSRQPVNN
jgi:hypothetical protein